MRHPLLHTILSLFYGDTCQVPPASNLVPADPPRANLTSISRRGGLVMERKVEGSAAYPRRVGPGSWARTGGRKWQWSADGNLKFKKVTIATNWPELVPVVPPAAVITREQGRQIWTAMAPIHAGRSPFKRLFQPAHQHNLEA